ncbi:hypothetical protein J1605_009696 [Eschrichtius robustus]|uniref:Protein ST7 homolog n=1 Tax=Eschrichtius robustus TaxID=9764 RepID=A0AB34GUZ9_ESCRO|nr:hypothetical protein J1605_009696 [Eschrichtius robustus]
MTQSLAFRMIPYPLEKGHLFYPYPICTETADRELLPSFHEVSVYPKKELPFFILFTAGLCSFTAMLALLTHQFPELMGVFAKASLLMALVISMGSPQILKAGWKALELWAAVRGVKGLSAHTSPPHPSEPGGRVQKLEIPQHFVCPLKLCHGESGKHPPIQSMAPADSDLGKPTRSSTHLTQRAATNSSCQFLVDCKKA